MGSRPKPAELGLLAEEQAALRRVATFVAQGAPANEVFAAVAGEVAQVMHLPMVAVCRYDDGNTLTVLAEHSDRPHVLQRGTRWPLDGQSVVGRVKRTGRPARIEDYTDIPGTLASEARKAGHERTAGAPIVVAGRVWGVMVASSPDAPLPDRAETRLAEFTELVAAAISNSEARESLSQLAEEQAALRRVATLVAQGAPPSDVFAAVSVEVAQLVPAEGAALTRFEGDGTVTALSGWTSAGGYAYVGRRFDLEGTVSGLIFETRRPGRIDNYDEAPGVAAAAAREMGWRSSVGSPITVEGRLWGVLAVISKSDQPLPAKTEQRLADFAEHVATAIANAENREQLTRLAEEQAALRRVATLVAGGAPPTEVFDEVIAEVGRLVGSDAALLLRYEPDETFTVVGGWSTSGPGLSVGARFPVVPGTAAQRVFETRQPARVGSYSDVAGPSAAAARELGWQSSVGAPVIVDGRLWGMAMVLSKSSQPLPADTEGRLTEFTELVATAIANAESRAELDASRARIVATADATRQRIERDLHDGAQQQLVSLALELRAAEAAVPPELAEHRAELARAVDGLTSVLDDLREIALGIHPAILAEGGLGPALKTLARRSPIPVRLDVDAKARLPEPVEVAAYYVVAEALTNAAKYARASLVDVTVEVRSRTVHVIVCDDGEGGADPARGTGLVGLKDRAEAIGGALSLQSPLGSGTALSVELPLDA